MRKVEEGRVGKVSEKQRCGGGDSVLVQRIVSREYWEVTIRTVGIKTARRVQRVEKGMLGRIFDPSISLSQFLHTPPQVI